MSVPVSRRGESKAEFVNAAYDLHVMTIRLCMKMEKRLTFFLAQDISRKAAECHDHTKSANSIYPSNQRDAQQRRYHLTEANCAVQVLYSFIDIAYGYNQMTEGKVTYKEMEMWLDQASKVAKLLANTKKADMERWRSLPP